MKKKNILNLIRCYAEKNDAGFRAQAYEIAREFDSTGDVQLAEYIMSLLSSANTLVPQMQEDGPAFLERMETGTEPMLLLPDSITEDLLGIVNAVQRQIGIHKFLFEGAPGTGKTQAAMQIARIMHRELYLVDFSALIDSRLGQTQKNIGELFRAINGFARPERVVVLFDEIDALALDRTDVHDLREMGRATSELLKWMDRLDERIVLVATTNLFSSFDPAFARRFDAVISFDRYSQEDLLQIAEQLLGQYLIQARLENRDVRLFRKIMRLMPELPSPGILKNMIRTAIAFSDPGDDADYFRRLYTEVCHEEPGDLSRLREQHFTVREIEKLTSRSRSSVSRDLRSLGQQS